jgi:hypothetical protein
MVRKWLNRFMRWLWALGALVLMPATASATPELAGVTTVQADSPAYADVIVSKPLHLMGDLGSRPRPRLEGDGSVILLALRRLDHASDKGARDSVVFERLGPPGHRVQGTSAIFGCERDCGDEGGAVTVPGRYRLYLLSDKPAKATLPLSELSGSLDLHPMQSAAFDTHPLGVFQLDFPDTAVIGGWGTQAADGGFMGMYAWFDRAGAGTLDRAELCFLDTGETQDGSEFGPGCSQGPPDPLLHFHPFGNGSYMLWSGAQNYPAGRYGLGLNVTHVGGVAPGGGAGFWAGFNDDEPPLPDPVAAPAAGRLSLASARARVRGRWALVRLRCSGEGPCRGALAIGGRAKRVALPAGARITVRVALPSSLRGAVKRRSSADTRLVLRTRTATGIDETVLRVTLRRR